MTQPVATTPENLDYADAERGDELTIRFTSSGISATFDFIEMMARGIVIVTDKFHPFDMTPCTDPEGSQSYNFRLNNGFGMRAGLCLSRHIAAGHIDRLRVVTRARPLIDTSVLENEGAHVAYRFKADGLPGVSVLLELYGEHAALLLDDDPDHRCPGLLRSSSLSGEWVAGARSGGFLNFMNGAGNLHRACFINEVLPHLELLR